MMKCPCSESESNAKIQRYIIKHILSCEKNPHFSVNNNRLKARVPVLLKNGIKSQLKVSKPTVYIFLTERGCIVISVPI
jgi:hypothetical protein